MPTWHRESPLSQDTFIAKNPPWSSLAKHKYRLRGLLLTNGRVQKITQNTRMQERRERFERREKIKQKRAMKVSKAISSTDSTPFT